jgi:tripartite-type tricarboxylate transporter receptor subunit TctC
MRSHLGAAACAALLLAAGGASAQQSVADFYKGKSIDLYIGFTQGGGYDLYARLVARHMTKHIAGNPNIVPRQMVGAGSRKATAYMVEVAPRDGTALATAEQSLPLQQALGEVEAPIDATKLGWIGNPSEDNNILIMWHATGVKTVEQTTAKQYVIGATGPNTSAQYPQVLNTLIGTKFKIITGYPGGADINLAMERGEVDGRGSNAWASQKATHPEWLRDGKINILVQTGLTKAPDLPHVPLLMDLATNPDDRAALKLLSAPTAVGRPLFTTPGVPTERITALRRAFDATMKDPDFQADAKKASLDLNPMSGETLQKVVEDVVATPKPIVERLRKALELRDISRDLAKEREAEKGGQK